MGASDILISSLGSRLVRTEVTGAATGVRSITQKPPNQGGFLDWLKGVLGAFVNFGGWIIGGILGGLSFSFTTVWSLIVSAGLQLYAFNWNTTDAQLDQYIASMRNIIASQLGETFGNVFGYLVCGVVPAATIFAFNEALGLYLLKEVGEEAFDEFMGNLRALIQFQARLTAQEYLIGAYKNIRRAIKFYLKDPTSTQSRFFSTLLGTDVSKAVNYWGSPNAKPWSFRRAVEETIESIKDPWWENFWEEFHEEAIDACIEAGYVIAGGLDSWVLQQKIAKDKVFGEEKTIELIPNREVPEERLVLAGNEKILKPQLPLIMANHGLLSNRDVGQWMGEPIREMVKTAPLSIQLVITLSGVHKPPFMNADGTRGKRVSVTIPNVNRGKVDWEKIKLAAGGTNGYMWGRFMGSAKLDTGHYFKVYAATAEEAKDRVEAYLDLSKSVLVGLSISEQTKEGTRKIYDSLYNKPTKIYPAYFTIINQVKVLNEESGRANLSGVYKSKKYQIPLYADTKPDNFEELINDLFSIPGATT